MTRGFDMTTKNIYVKKFSLAMLFLLALPFYASANTDATTISIGDIIVSAEYVAEDEIEFEIDVSITGNPGFAAFVIRIDYDKSALTALSVERGPVLYEGIFTSNLATASGADWIQVSFLNAMDIVGDGTLFRIRFSVTGDDVSGEFPLNISIDYDNLLNQRAEYLSAELIDGVVTIIGEPEQTLPETESELEPDEPSLPHFPGSNWSLPINEETSETETLVHTIIFQSYEGFPLWEILADDGNILASPPDPTRDGFSFQGWYLDFEFTVKYDFDIPVTNSFTLYARWISMQICENPFIDVNSNDWFSRYVELAVENHLMQGVSPTEFAPNSPTTRAMFVTVLWRLAGEPTANADNQFVDVSSGTWYTTAVSWAVQNGMVLGVSETEFVPNVEITREQMAAILYRGLDIFAPDTIVTQVYFIFEDMDEISDFAKNGIQTLANMGVMQGRPNGNFDPQGLATRAEIAVVMSRI